MYRLPSYLKIPLLWIPVLLFATSVATAQPKKEDLLAALALNPEDRAALYNLGLLNYLNGAPEESVALWSRLEKLDPANWKLKAKLIQAYSSAGDKLRREAKIEELKTMRAAGSIASLNQSRYFVRDQFVVGELRVYVLEFYNMDAGFSLGPVLWKFDLTKGDRSIGQFISLGSYDQTTEYSRQTGSIGPNDRVFHLDSYGPNQKHKTLGMYKNQPDYDFIRDQVIKVVQKELSAG